MVASSRSSGLAMPLQTHTPVCTCNGRAGEPARHLTVRAGKSRRLSARVINLFPGRDPAPLLHAPAPYREMEQLEQCSQRAIAPFGAAWSSLEHTNYNS